MTIAAIRVYQVDLPLREGRYNWSGGNFVEVFDSTVVAVETREGLVGWGECCPLGPAYLPSYAEGVRAGIREIGPHIIGLDPTAIGVVGWRMDEALRGHPYAKAPLDIACWDLLGRATGLPLVRLLGGAAQDSVPLYRAISQESPETMAGRIAAYREDGYHAFQLKVGGDPDIDVERIGLSRERLDRGEILIADANTGWTRAAAARVVNAIRDLDVFVEQPCASYEASLSVRRRTALPFVMDEVVDGLAALRRGLADDAFDAVNLKISKVGGLSPARLMRDLCADAGIAMIVEDTWGGDIATAAIAHLAQSTPASLCLAATDFNSYVTVEMAKGAPRRDAGAMRAPDGPGLGVEPDLSVLGTPLFEIVGK